MINIKITSSPDIDKCLEFEYGFEYIIIGKSKKNHLIIEDKKLYPSHICLKLVKDNLVCFNTESEFFFINGKKFKGEKILNIGDNIEIGDTKINIQNFKPLEEEIPTLEKLFNNAIIDSSEAESYLSQIELKLLEIGSTNEGT